jgi:hypothetical protein
LASKLRIQEFERWLLAEFSHRNRNSTIEFQIPDKKQEQKRPTKFDRQIIVQFV